MTQRFFGTDGIRGRFGEPPLDQPTVTALGRSVGRSLASGATVVMAGDTRESTPLIAHWMTNGLSQVSADFKVRWGGVLPTPAVAVVTRNDAAAELGLVLSASHNPYHDNGIKFFDARGRKLDDIAQATIERRLQQELKQPHFPVDNEPREVAHSLAGTLEVDPSVAQAYTDFLVSRFKDHLANLTVVLDTGHGAASEIAAAVFEEAGARVHLICAAPDGRNINHECGSTAPELAARKVKTTGADLGFAFDGDADRVIVADEAGSVRDGDEILYLWAKTLFEQNELDPPAIVATSMSNLGLERALSTHGIAVERCDVGDRAVAEMLQAKGLRLGGEQSGHIIDAARATTGDGLLSALAIAEIVSRGRRPLSHLLSPFKRFPQRLHNIVVGEKVPFDEVPAIADHAARIAAQLGSSGRLVLRYSGTEPLARVMIEAEDKATVDRLVDELSATITNALGA